MRWRFYPRYPDFHRGVRQSFEIHSLVLDHSSAQRHAWYSREKKEQQHLQSTNPYPDPNTFYNAIRDAERGFMRSFTNSKEVTMMMFLVAFALKLVPFDELEPIRKRRKSKAVAGGSSMAIQETQRSKGEAWDVEQPDKEGQGGGPRGCSYTSCWPEEARRCRGCR